MPLPKRRRPCGLLGDLCLATLNSLLLLFSLTILVTIHTTAVHATSASLFGIHTTTAKSKSATGTILLTRGRTMPINEEQELLGGGAINEKKRINATTDVVVAQQSSGFDPVHVRAHLFHALEGLARYPNYLASRWNENDMDHLEQALLQQIEQVRRQRIMARERVADADQQLQLLLRHGTDGARWRKLVTVPTTWDQVCDEILDPAAVQAIFGNATNRSIFPSVAEVVSGLCVVEIDVGHLTRFMDEEMPDVFAFPLLSQTFCREVCAFVQALAKQQQLLQQQQSVDSRPSLGRQPAINLDHIGLQWVNDLIFHLVLRPIAHHLFFNTEMGNADLDWRNGYIAGYSATPSPDHATPRERLVSHTDDSEVTLNVCLGENDFQGGLLEFRGLRGTDAEQGELVGSYQPQIGRAVIHAGRHFHDVTQVTRGNRYAWILWARSWRGVRAVQCPCCWLNRRKEGGANKNCGGPCICGAKWN